MNCNKCQTQNRPEAKFCSECGFNLASTCHACGFAVEAKHRFCSECGMHLKGRAQGSAQLAAPVPVTSIPSPPNANYPVASAPVPPAPVAAAAVTPAAPVSAPVAAANASAANASDQSTGGERRKATVVFSDLSGYTSMNERLDPEQVEAIMSLIKREAVKIIESEGGTVNQFVGDEIVSVFGIPIGTEDDAKRAVKATIRLHEMVDRISLESEAAKHGIHLQMHSGINTGLIVTHLKDDRDGRFGMTGDTVSTGARLRAAAQSGEILVGPETQRQVGGHFALTPLSEMHFKGKGSGLVPYRVELGAVPNRSARTSRFFGDFIGRDLEVQHLRAAFVKASRKSGQVVAVVADTGMGKSRLFHEFHKQLDPEKSQVWEGNCPFDAKDSPYSAFMVLLRNVFKISPGADMADNVKRVEEAVMETDSKLKPHIPLYLSILRLTSDHHPMPTGLAGIQLSLTIFDAMAQLVAAYARLKPMAILLEDWQWADPASDALLKHLIPFVERHAVFMAVNYRRECKPQWSRVDHLSEISLSPLDVESSRELMLSRWATKHVPADVVELIFERSGGTPLFIEEICQSLLDEGAVAYTNSSISITRPVAEISVPSSVQNVIQARLDRLDPVSKEVVRIASVVGREFSRHLIAVLIQHESDLTASLDTLKDQNIIQLFRTVPREEFMFRHSLTQQVAYETILHRQRKQLHTRVAEAVELHFSEQIEEYIELLAFHYERSESADKAIDYLERAGDRAAQLFSVASADSNYVKALDLIAAGESSAMEQRRYVDIALKWAPFGHKSPSSMKINKIEYAQHCAQAIGDTAAAVKLTYWHGMMYNWLGDAVKAQKRYLKAIETGERTGQPELITLPYNQMGRICLFAAEFQQGLKYLEKGIALLRLGNQVVELANSLVYVGSHKGCLGRFSEARASYVEAREVISQGHSPVITATIEVMEAITLLRQASWQEALDLATRSVTMAREIDLMTIVASGSAVQARALFMMGQQARGLDLMEEGLEIARKTGAGIVTCCYFGLYAEMCYLGGDLLKAERVTQEALKFYDESGMNIGRADALRAAALVAHGRGEAEAAATRMREAISWARAKGARSELAVALYRFSQILDKKGDAAAAAQAADEASRLFTELGMTWWVASSEQKAA